MKWFKKKPLDPFPVVDYSEKLKAAKEKLGTNWLLHPNYVPNPKHKLTRTDYGNQSK